MNQQVLYYRLALFVFSVLLLSCRIAVAEESVARGAALASACASCHGPEGRSTGAIPSLQVLSKEMFVVSLRAFRSGERQGTVMNRIAQGLDEADIEAVAAHFAGRRR
jgi:sulfide dehydrogenase cytochrome subunit